SLTGRLTAVVVGAQLLLAIGLVLVGITYSRRQLLAAFDMSLQGKARAIAALVYYPPADKPGLLFDDDEAPPPFDASHPDIYQVISPARQFEAHSRNFNSSFLRGEPAHNDYWNFISGGVPYRGLILRKVSIRDADTGTSDTDVFVDVFYAAPTLDINRRADEVGMMVGGASLLLLLLTGLLAAWAVRRGLWPLHDLAAQAAGISVKNWNFRPPQSALQTSELAPLAQAIETVLGRLEQAFIQQREFLADAAHELKTSVAILKSTFQSLLQKPRSPHEYRAGLLDLLGDVDRLEQLLDRMLRLARAEQQAADGAQHGLEVADLASTCEMAVARIKALAGTREVEVQLACDGSSELRADPQDLELVWVNLLENAIQHSPPGAAVHLRLSREADNAVVSVQDWGTGIDPEDLPYIFERFRRGDRSRSRETGGFGLGLAIAKAIVEAYGGTIRAASTLREGTIISVRLPLSEQAEAQSSPVGSSGIS
ncbi:MAG TPA: HAMP domain-containing sensor histidine kinase, partial [Terriglobales bacterium]|nr:HAMP domain-containing sensor histidine kinase [Terriglobales bacterium]